MSTTNLIQVEEAIQLWKKNNINRCEMPFSCGGDSMNDYHFEFYDNNDKQVHCQELTEFFENEVFNQVEFYVNSDGHYQGESGEVSITLEDEDFSYSKFSESEWSESFTEIGYCDLTEKEVEFVKKYIHSIVGGTDSFEPVINYKGDCILNDEEEELLKSISDKVKYFAEDYKFEYSQGEETDWFNYTTNMVEEMSNIPQNNPTVIKDNAIAVQVTRSFTVYMRE